MPDFAAEMADNAADIIAELGSDVTLRVRRRGSYDPATRSETAETLSGTAAIRADFDPVSPVDPHADARSAGSEMTRVRMLRADFDAIIAPASQVVWNGPEEPPGRNASDGRDRWVWEVVLPAPYAGRAFVVREGYGVDRGAVFELLCVRERAGSASASGDGGGS